MSDEEISVSSDGCVLAGTFTSAADPVAAALLIAGSGRIDRNSDARLPLGMWLRTGVTRAVADALAGARVATLRYDKRGVGASSGDFWRSGMPERLTDMRAARDWLAERAYGLPLLAIGHSEGTFYAAQLAADGVVAGAVLLSAPAQPGGQVLSWQTGQVAAHLPVSTRRILRLLHVDVTRSQRKNQAKIEDSTADFLRVSGRRVNARWFRDFIAYDPVPVLARVTVPVLAVTGGHDMQAPPDDVKAIGELVGGPFEGHVADGLSHLLRPDPQQAGPRGYRRAVRSPVSPEVLELITDWVSRHWGQPPTC